MEREEGQRELTEGEGVTGGGHQLLVGHDNTDRADDIHRPSSDVRHRRRFLLTLHLPLYHARAHTLCVCVGHSRAIQIQKKYIKKNGDREGSKTLFPAPIPGATVGDGGGD